MLNKQIVHLNLQGGIDKKDDNFKTIPSKLLQLNDGLFDEANTIRMRNPLKARSTTVQNAPAAAVFFTSGVAFTDPQRVFKNDNTLLVESRKSGIFHKVSPSGLTLVDMAEQRFTDLSGTGTTHPLRPGASAITSQVANAFPMVDPTTQNAFQYDCAGYASRSCWAIELGNYGGIMVYVVDESTKQVIYSYHIKGTGGTNKILCCPRVIYVPSASKFYVYYADYDSGATSYTIRVVSLASTGSLSTPSPTTVATSSVAAGAIGSTSVLSALFDVATDTQASSLLFLVYRDVNATSDIVFKRVSSSDGFTVGATTSQIPLTVPTALTALVIQSATTRQYVALHSSTAGGLYAYGWQNPQTPGVVGARLTICSGASVPFAGRITAWCDSGTSGYFEVLCEAFVSAPSSPLTAAQKAGAYLAYAFVGKDLATLPLAGTALYPNSSGGVASSSQLLHSHMLMNNVAAAPFADAGASYRGMVTTYYPSRTQPTITAYDPYGFTLGWTGATYPGVVQNKADLSLPIARVAPGSAGYETALYQTHRRIPSGFWKSSTEFVLPHMKFVADTQLSQGVFVTPFVLSRTDFDFTSQLGFTETNGLTIMAGGTPAVFDGNSVYEEGSHVAPEILDSTLTAAGAGTYTLLNPSAGTHTYNICFTYGWTDARGNWHESAPSNVLPISITSGSGNYSFTPNILKSATRKSNRQLIMYRTLNGATTGPYYRAFYLSGTAASESGLTSNEQLYTNPTSLVGAPLYHDPLPGHRHSCLFQNRLWVFGCNDGSDIYYTNVIQQGRAPEPNLLLKRRAPGSMGRIVGGAALDGKLYVFGEKQIGVIYGSGPSDSGLQDNYSDVEIIVPDNGAKWESPKSIVSTKEGIWFLSQTGIRLLGRDGNIIRGQDGKENGSEIDSYMRPSPTTGTMPRVVAVQSTDSQQVRFYTIDSVTTGCFVYDCFWGQWSRFANHACVDAAFVGVYYHVKSNATIVYSERGADTAAADSDGYRAALEFETPWLSLTGMQGFQRVYAVQMLLSTDPITLGDSGAPLYYKFNATVAYDYEGTGTAYRTNYEPSGWQSADSVFPFMYKLDRQKCASVKFTFKFELQHDYLLKISDLALIVGAKKGLYKTPNRL